MVGGREGVKVWVGQGILRAILNFIILPTIDIMGVKFHLVIFHPYLTKGYGRSILTRCKLLLIGLMTGQ